MTEIAVLLPEYPVVMEFHGVGRIVGPQIMAEVGDVLRFEKKNLLFALPVLRHRRMNPVNLNRITELFPKKVHLI